MTEMAIIEVACQTKDEDRHAALSDALCHLRVAIKTNPNLTDMLRYRELSAEYLNSCVHPMSFIGMPQIGIHDCANKWLSSVNAGVILSSYSAMFGNSILKKLMLDYNTLQEYLTGQFCCNLYPHVEQDKQAGLGPVKKSIYGFCYVTPKILNLGDITHIFSGTTDLKEFRRIISVHSNGGKPMTKEVIQKFLKRIYDAVIAVRSTDLKSRVVNGYRPLETINTDNAFITPGILRHEVAYEQTVHSAYAIMMAMKFWSDKGFDLHLRELHI